MKERYDCIVIGAGHAGVEAALAASRMGCATLMVTLFWDTIGQMSCNPAIGGVGKGQLVKEIDVLGGQMAVTADRTGIQFRQLNASKGAAVRSSRCQSDRKAYKLFMQDVIREQENLDVLEDEAVAIVAQNGCVCALKTKKGYEIPCTTLVVAAGTFLEGRIHLGPEIIPGGRIHEPASCQLTESLRELGFEILSFKTGTPPRLDGKTIDFNVCEPQYSDEIPVPFSFRTRAIPPEQKLLPCYITKTNQKTHDIIKANMHLSPMYSGQINSTGVRYCPSIEDKLKKFSDKMSHHVFLEPEGLDTDEYYPNGISTGLPREVQEEFVHSIKGLENAKINTYGYSIEHAVIPPTSLRMSLETKKVKNLFLAGQINGTTGYEEAGVQGILAGINAALRVRGKEAFALRRDEAYAGVLIDDLVTKGTEEPYRMFTSRVEYRLIVREDNADDRLAKYAYDFGLMSKDDYKAVCEKYRLIHDCIAYFKNTRVHPSDVNSRLESFQSSALRQPAYLSDLLRRPELDYAKVCSLDPENPDGIADLKVIEQIEYEIKYEGFIARQLKDVEKFKNIENIRIPQDIDYDDIPGISIEIRQKLKTFSPENLGQAHRISGVTPAAISILMVYLRKQMLSRKL